MRLDSLLWRKEWKRTTARDRGSFDTKELHFFLLLFSPFVLKRRWADCKRSRTLLWTLIWRRMRLFSKLLGHRAEDLFWWSSSGWLSRRRSRTGCWRFHELWRQSSENIPTYMLDNNGNFNISLPYLFLCQIEKEDLYPTWSKELAIVWKYFEEDAVQPPS